MKAAAGQTLQMRGLFAVKNILAYTGLNSSFCQNNMPKLDLRNENLMMCTFLSTDTTDYTDFWGFNLRNLRNLWIVFAQVN